MDVSELRRSHGVLSLILAFSFNMEVKGNPVSGLSRQTFSANFPLFFGFVNLSAPIGIVPDCGVLEKRCRLRARCVRGELSSGFGRSREQNRVAKSDLVLSVIKPLGVTTGELVDWRRRLTPLQGHDDGVVIRRGGLLVDPDEADGGGIRDRDDVVQISTAS